MHIHKTELFYVSVNKNYFLFSFLTESKNSQFRGAIPSLHEQTYTMNECGNCQYNQYL